MMTWKPWKPVAMKKADPNSPALAAAGEKNSWSDRMCQYT